MALQSKKTKAQEHLIEPRNELELVLVKTWEDILNVRGIGIRDNFWDLGGQSVLAFQLLIEIRKTFRTDFPVATFLQNPTVEHLANILREQDEVNYEEPELDSGRESATSSEEHPRKA
jgi:acyl carrier protein